MTCLSLSNTALDNDDDLHTALDNDDDLPCTVTTHRPRFLKLTDYITEHNAYGEERKKDRQKERKLHRKKEGKKERKKERRKKRKKERKKEDVNCPEKQRKGREGRRERHR